MDDLVHYGAPLEAAERAVVLLHGRGQDPTYMEEHVVRRLRLDRRVAFVAPAAPDATWYPCGFMAARADNEPYLSRSLTTVGATVASLLEAGFEPQHVVLIGFSQGACLCAEYVARHPGPLGGLVAFTGGLIGAPSELAPVDGSLAGLRAYFGTSDVDEWVPFVRVEETAALYRAAGADVVLEVFPGMGHEVCDIEIEAARRLLA